MRRGLPAALATFLSLVGPTGCNFFSLPGPPTGVIRVSSGDLVTTEAGGTSTFTVTLGSRPTADVRISLKTSNPEEGTVSPESLTFTALTWNAPQTVTATGVDDEARDGDQQYSILLTAVSSADDAYNLLPVPAVLCTNLDDESAGILVTPPPEGLVTAERGRSGLLTFQLRSAPLFSVRVNISSSNPAEATVRPAVVEFTPSNWNSLHTVTVSGGDDVVADGDQEYMIVIEPSVSSDANYNGIDAADVRGVNIDDESPGVLVSPTVVSITELGDSATISVALQSQPAADVTLAVASSNTAEGRVFPLTLTFTPANWNAPQDVTVTGVDDSIADGNQSFAIVLGLRASADAQYAALDPQDVTVTNVDDETAGITVTNLSGLQTTEAGGSATFTIRLNSQPLADVVIPLASSSAAEGTVSPATLRFTPQNWNAAQAATVRGVDDAVADGGQPYAIRVGVTSSEDPAYAGIDPPDVPVVNADNDSAGITVAPTTGLSTTESGGTSTFTVRLNSQPTASVTIALSSSDVSEGTVAPDALTFTPDNWNAPQAVIVRGLNDSIADGNQPYAIVTDAATSIDARYDGLDPADVTVRNTDDDSAGITVLAAPVLSTTERGKVAIFTVRLNSEPSANVTVPVSTSDFTEGTLSVASVVFTPANWGTGQEIVVTGANDDAADGDQPYLVILGPAESADGAYNLRDPADVPLTNLDDDRPGFAVSPIPGGGLVTSESGEVATLSIALASQPTSPVVVSVSSNDLTEGEPAPGILTFSVASWATPQTVTISGIADAVADGDQPFLISFSVASDDASYATLVLPDVLVTNRDAPPVVP